MNETLTTWGFVLEGRNSRISNAAEATETSNQRLWWARMMVYATERSAHRRRPLWDSRITEWRRGAAISCSALLNGIVIQTNLLPDCSHELQACRSER